MTDDPFYCDDCDMELSHDDIEVVEMVPQINPDSYEMKDQLAEVYECSGCGFVIGFDLE
jgi:transposase